MKYIKTTCAVLVNRQAMHLLQSLSTDVQFFIQTIQQMRKMTNLGHATRLFRRNLLADHINKA